MTILHIHVGGGVPKPLRIRTWHAGFVAIVLITTFLPFAGAAAQDANRPKVVLIVTDDQAYDDVGAYGATGYSTPNLDTMADEGILFSNDVGNKRYGRSEWARAQGADSSFVSPLTQLMRNEEIVESGPDQTQLTRRYT